MKNINFFKNIDSEIKAYLLGFHVGDGCIQIRDRKSFKEYSIHISSIDKEIIELFQQNIYPEISIKKETNKMFGNYKCKDAYKISFYSKDLALPLIELGYGIRKTKRELKLPPLNDNLLRHFIRGYFDADGTCGVYITKRSDRPIGTRVKPTFHITSNTENLLKEIQNYLNKLNINVPLYQCKKGYWYLKSGSIRETRKLYKLFYTNCSFYLKRKELKFKEVMLTSREIRELKLPSPRNA